MSKRNRKTGKVYPSTKSGRSDCPCDYHTNNRLHSRKVKRIAADDSLFQYMMEIRDKGIWDE